MLKLALTGVRSVKMNGGFLELGLVAAFAIAIALLIVFVLV